MPHSKADWTVLPHQKDFLRVNAFRGKDTGDLLRLLKANAQRNVKYENLWHYTAHLKLGEGWLHPVVSRRAQSVGCIVYMSSPCQISWKILF